MGERVAIVGSREWSDAEAIRAYVRALPSDAIVVSGGARGVDTIAELAARERGLGVLVYCIPTGLSRAEFIEWAYARNERIVRVSTRVVAFWDGKSRGTAHSISVAERMRRPVEIIRP